MDTNRLHQFQVLSETENLREAASLLKISHPGLSKSIRVLEDELGTALLVKDGRGIKITPAGRRLLSAMKKCLDTESELRAMAKGLELKASPRVRIGTFEVFSTYLASRIAKSLGKDNTLELHELLPGKIEEEILSERVDYGISYLPIPKSGIEFTEITKIKMGLYGRKGRFDKTAFRDLPFVAPLSLVEGSPTKARGLDGWPDHEHPRSVRYSVTLMESALELTRDGLAVAFLPKFVVKLHNERVRTVFNLTELPMPKGVSTLQPVFAIKRKNAPESPGFRALCRVLRELGQA